MVTWCLFAYPHVAGFKQADFSEAAWSRRETEYAYVFDILCRTQSFIRCCVNSTVHIEGLTSLLSRKVQLAVILACSIWVLNFLVWLVSARISLMHMIPNMRSLNQILYSFIIAICTFQTVGTFLKDVAEPSLNPWWLTVAFGWSLWPSATLQKIGVTFREKVDLDCVAVCQKSDCEVYYCSSLAAEPRPGHLGLHLIMLKSNVSDVFFRKYMKVKKI